ncbi:hypothetical protein RchiOBHm_Chr1g0344581 [Rosa chinensis]|uniref:Uncharacterized protein n=1 Tax=Rosa chinensis TaxID=74649 RepID=A0A2P6SEJ7_ROSCH|nr:hypothetical protein RchiOBHm_Chr1g0344581 [Rosa chinensis]
MWVGEERSDEAGRRFGSGEDGVALTDEGFGEELAGVAKAYDGDLEIVGGLALGGEVGFVFEELGGV